MYIVHFIARVLQINNIVTCVNLEGNDMQDRGARYVAEALLENTFVEELVSGLAVPFRSSLVGGDQPRI